MKRTATAVWAGGLRAGEGTVRSGSGVFEKVIYTFGTSTIDVPCTSPLEMLAAAEASCMALMVSKELAVEGIMSERIETRAELTVTPRNHDDWSIPTIHLTITGRAPGADSAMFEKAVQRAKRNCPVTRCLKTEITAEATLEAAEPATVAQAGEAEKAAASVPRGKAHVRRAVGAAH